MLSFSFSEKQSWPQIDKAIFCKYYPGAIVQFSLIPKKIIEKQRVKGFQL